MAPQRGAVNRNDKFVRASRSSLSIQMNLDTKALQTTGRSRHFLARGYGIPKMGFHLRGAEDELELSSGRIEVEGPASLEMGPFRESVLEMP